MSAVVLGIDGGGTRTRASIVNGEQVLAFAENGSIKRLRVGAQAAEEHLRELLAEVYAQAGVNGVRPRRPAWPVPPCRACRNGSGRSFTTSRGALGSSGR